MFLFVKYQLAPEEMDRREQIKASLQTFCGEHKATLAYATGGAIALTIPLDDARDCDGHMRSYVPSALEMACGGRRKGHLTYVMH